MANAPLNIKKEQKRIFFLTRQGLEKMKKDFNNLSSLKLAKVSGEAPKIIHSDDLDPEYLDFEDNITLLEAKLADLKYIIENSEIIKKPGKEKLNTVYLGAKILLDIDGQKDEFTILGSLEANPSLGIISDESPVGRALLGRRVGEEVVISSPIKIVYKIKKIEYS